MMIRIIWNDDTDYEEIMAARPKIPFVLLFRDEPIESDYYQYVESILLEASNGNVEDARNI